jgi:sporulation protein YlmC with PRC-barrel domain
MMLPSRIFAAAVLALALPAAALAQQDTSAKPPAQTPGMEEPGPGGVHLSVATVKMEGGTRASKVIGAPVFNRGNQQVGTVDDVILNHEDMAALGVISVGGFLGVGGKLVAVPYKSLQLSEGKVILPDASKEALNKMPSFTYAQ